MKAVGIVCDVGGTLLLTDELHQDAWRKALASERLATEINIRRAFSGLAEGLDSFGIATSMGVGVKQAERLALAKQRHAQVLRPSRSNTATIEWLRGQEHTVLAAISHSDEAWTRGMLQLAQVLQLFAFVLGRRNQRRVPKPTLVSDATAILRGWWGVQTTVYCGDTDYDEAVARQLELPFVDARAL